MSAAKQEDKRDGSTSGLSSQKRSRPLKQNSSNPSADGPDSPPRKRTAENGAIVAAQLVAPNGDSAAEVKSVVEGERNEAHLRMFSAMTTRVSMALANRTRCTSEL